jgi:hypothetical protein
MVTLSTSVLVFSQESYDTCINNVNNELFPMLLVMRGNVSNVNPHVYFPITLLL